MIAVQVSKGGSVWRVCLAQNEVTVGRQRADIPLTDSTISKMHLRVVLRDGKLIIVDLKSTNGTYVNGKRMSSPQVLKESDAIYAGPFKMSFSTAADPKAAKDGKRPPAWVGRASADDETMATAIPAPVVVAPPPTPNAGFEDTPAEERTPARAMPVPELARRPPPPLPQPIARGPVRTSSAPPHGSRKMEIIDDDTALGVIAVRAPSPAPPSGIGLDERVGDDGLTETWRARFLGDRVRGVCLKSGLEGDDEFVKLLRDAARLSRCLSSTRWPRFLAFEQGMLVTTPAPGTPLPTLLANGPLPVHVAVFLAREVALALADLHAARDEDGEPLNVIHRGIAPSAIEIDAHGEVLLADLMLAKHAAAWRETRTQAGVIKGKIAYLAPECLRGRAVDARADLFALGTLLFECITGKSPFDRESAMDTLQAVLNEELPLDGMPAPVASILASLLQKSPALRMATATKVAHALRVAGNELPAVDHGDLAALVR